MPGEGVLEGSSCCVVGLAGVTEDAGCGGEHDEEVELRFRGTVVEIDGSLDFRAYGGLPFFEGHSLEYRVLFGRAVSG